MKAQQQSLLFLHCSVLLFGGTALFSKLIGLPALDITVYRTGVAAIVLFTLLTLQKKKISLFCNVKKENVIPALNANSIYEVPSLYYKAGLDRVLLDDGKLALEVVSTNKKDRLHVIQEALVLNKQYDVQFKLIKKELKSKKLKKDTMINVLIEACSKELISKSELIAMKRAYKLKEEVISVDSFKAKEYKGQK